jgi:hypothetical protein
VVGIALAYDYLKRMRSSGRTRAVDVLISGMMLMAMADLIVVFWRWNCFPFRCT